MSSSDSQSDDARSAQRDPICLYDGDRLLFDADADDPDCYVGTYVIADANGVERGRGRFWWDNGICFGAWHPGQQPRSGHQPADNGVRAVGTVEGKPDGPAMGDDPSGPTAGLPAAGVPDTKSVANWVDYRADNRHDHPRPYLHIHEHFHPEGADIHVRGHHAHDAGAPGGNLQARPPFHS